MEFGERVREIRTERGLSITALADHLGVTKVYVSDVERGRRAPLSLTRIKQVSDVLGCDPFDLYLLAVRSRGHVVLPTSDIGEEQSRLAAVLSYRWSELNNNDVSKMIGAL